MIFYGYCDLVLITGVATHSLQKLMMVVRPQTKVLFIFLSLFYFFITRML